MELYNETIKDYLCKLSSKTPAPGGGSATAALLSLGIALFIMCFRYSKVNIEDTEFKKRERELTGYLRKAMKLIQEDKEAYLRLSNLLKEKDKKGIKDAYLGCTLVPLKMLDICQKVIEIIEILSSKIKKDFISDFMVSLNFLETALLSANIFVSLNLKYVGDRAPLEPYLKIDVAQIQKRLKKLKGVVDGRSNQW